MMLLAQFEHISFYLHDKQVIAAWDQDKPITDEQSIEADKLFDLLVMPARGKAWEGKSIPVTIMDSRQ